MRRFCASVPNTTTGCGPNRFRCTADTAAEPSLPMVRITIAAAEMPRPAPPWSLGIVTPNQPPRATASQNSSGQRPSRSLAQPVVGVERRAQPLDRLAEAFLLGGEGEIHQGFGRTTLSGDSP